MAERILAGTPAIRYPDPLVKRVNPNGTQEYSAYQALFVWYWANPPQPPPPDTGPPPGYYTGLTGVSEYGVDLYYMLFGSDYPAICTITSTYPEGGYFIDGTINHLYNMTFNETAASGLSGGTNYAPLLQNAMSFIGQESYKRILTGPTLTNGVTVSGFSQLTVLPNRGTYATNPLAGGSPPRPDFRLQADVLLNSATVHSTSPYFGLETVVYDGEPGILPRLRQPVILYEPDLTQKIVDDGYTIVVDNQLCGPTIYDVVGIWAIPDYSPVPVPTPTPPPTPPPTPAGEARSFTAPSSGMTRADETLLVRALTTLSSVQEAVKRSR